MAERLDPYGAWGDWELHQFKVEVARWRDTEHPPADVHAHVNRWWPRLKQTLERSAAARVSAENDPEGNLLWMWVPGAAWLDEAGYFRVQCFFRLYENDGPPRVVCDELHSVQSMTPADVDRFDGMGSSIVGLGEDDSGAG